MTKIEWDYGPADPPNEDLTEMSDEDLRYEISLCHQSIEMATEKQALRLRRRIEDAEILLHDRKEEESE